MAAARTEVRGAQARGGAANRPEVRGRRRNAWRWPVAMERNWRRTPRPEKGALARPKEGTENRPEARGRKRNAQRWQRRGIAARVPRTGGNRAGSTGSRSYGSGPVRKMTGNRSLTGPKKPGQTERSGLPVGVRFACLKTRWESGLHA
jgi:hypothetical protein